MDYVKRELGLQRIKNARAPQAAHIYPWGMIATENVKSQDSMAFLQHRFYKCIIKPSHSNINIH